MIASASEVVGSVLAIADLFAQVGTDPLVDWSRPSVLLTHPLQRTTIVPYVRGGDRWSAEAFKTVEMGGSIFPMEHLTLVQWWLEDAARDALARLAAAMRPNQDRLAPPRALALRHAFALLGDGPDADATFGERVELAAVESGHMTLTSGDERLPVILRYDEEDDQLEVLSLFAAFDGRRSRSELDALRSTFARRARAHEVDLRVVDVPGELATAIGVVSKLAPSAATTLRRALEAHLDVARGHAGMRVVPA